MCCVKPKLNYRIITSTGTPVSYSFGVNAPTASTRRLNLIGARPNGAALRYDLLQRPPLFMITKFQFQHQLASQGRRNRAGGAVVVVVKAPGERHFRALLVAFGRAKEPEKRASAPQAGRWRWPALRG